VGIEQDRIPNLIRVWLRQASIPNTKVISHAMQRITSLTHIVDNIHPNLAEPRKHPPAQVRQVAHRYREIAKEREATARMTK